MTQTTQQDQVLSGFQGALAPHAAAIDAVRILLVGDGQHRHVTGPKACFDAAKGSGAMPCRLATVYNYPARLLRMRG